MKRRLLVVVGLGAVALLTLSAWQRHYVRQSHGAELFWNDREAYLFVLRNSVGWKVNYVEWPYDWIRSYFRVHVPPDDIGSSRTVVWWSGGEMEKATERIDSTTPMNSLVDGTLFSGLDRKWLRARLVSTTENERDRYRKFASPVSKDFSDVNGWSHKAFLLPLRHGQTEYPFRIGDQPVRLIVRKDETLERIEILFTQDGGDPQPVISLDESPRQVSESEYATVFAH